MRVVSSYYYHSESDEELLRGEGEEKEGDTSASPVPPAVEKVGIYAVGSLIEDAQTFLVLPYIMTILSYLAPSV